MKAVARTGSGFQVMKWFGRSLLIGWLLLVLFVTAGFQFPKLVSRLFGWLAPYIVLIPLSLLFGTAVFVALIVYRAGMKRISQ